MLQGNSGLWVASFSWWLSTDLMVSTALPQHARMAFMAVQQALLGLCAADALPGSCPAHQLHSWCGAMVRAG